MNLPPPPPPQAPIPPRPDLAPPIPARRRRRWPIVAIAVVVVLALIAQLGVNVRERDPGAVRSGNGEFAFLQTSPDGPFRWNPCQPIRYQVNLEYAPTGALDDVKGAIARISEATGIPFVYDGSTVRTIDSQMGSAFQSRIPGESKYLPLLIAWVPHEHFDFVADTHRAAAFGLPYHGFGDLAREYVSGVIAMDAGEYLPSGFGMRYSTGVVLMHELGHVMGLAHVGAPDEIMWSPEVSDLKHPDVMQSDWGPGDLAGLRAVGESAGCLPSRGGD